MLGKRDWVMVIVLVGGVAAVLLSVCCNAPGGRQGTVDHNALTAEVVLAPTVEVEATAALAAVTAKLQAEVTAIKAGDIKIGGGGDSIIGWILAIGVVLSTPAGGLFYQHVLRPKRLKVEGRKSKVGKSKVESRDE